MKKFTEKLKNIGPGALVAAGFIGPGTVTTCTLSGANYGYTLLWAMLFSTIATIIFQEMSGRLGVITQGGLGEAIRGKFKNPVGKVLIAILIIAAIFVGNVAYETGNITGATMGLAAIMPNIDAWVWIAVIGVIAALFLASGSYKAVEKILVALVILMSVVFIVTAIIVKPDLGAVVQGLFVPTMPAENAWLTVVGLIGTTVVPYNLFLHASATSKKWHNKEDVRYCRIDTILAIGLGGLISMAIIITASATMFGTGAVVKSGADMAIQLEPLVGSFAKWFIGIGLFAAGFTSAITAPLSAAFATSGILGWGSDLKKMKFKAIWFIVLAAGVGMALSLQASPVEAILFAQAANALILPVIAIFLTVMVNDRKTMGEYKNGIFGNIMAIIVILVTIAISVRSLQMFFDSLQKLLFK